MYRFKVKFYHQTIGDLEINLEISRGKGKKVAGRSKKMEPVRC